MGPWLGAVEDVENHRKTVGKRWFHGIGWDLPNLVMTNGLLLKMAIEIVSFPIRHCDVP